MQVEEEEEGCRRDVAGARRRPGYGELEKKKELFVVAAGLSS